MGGRSNLPRQPHWTDFLGIALLIIVCAAAVVLVVVGLGAIAFFSFGAMGVALGVLGVWVLAEATVWLAKKLYAL